MGFSRSTAHSSADWITAIVVTESSTEVRRNKIRAFGGARISREAPNAAGGAGMVRVGLEEDGTAYGWTTLAIHRSLVGFSAEAMKWLSPLEPHVASMPRNQEVKRQSTAQSDAMVSSRGCPTSGSLTV